MDKSLRFSDFYWYNISIINNKEIEIIWKIKLICIGYARVSTQKQNLERQIEALTKFGITKENLFIDKKSGKDFNREDYQLLKQILKRTQNNVLVIKSIDRLGRNYQEIQKEWKEITTELKTDIVVLDMPILDTRKYKDTMGNFISDLILQVLSYVAENERTNIKTRQAEGIAVAKAKGKKFGRPTIELPKDFETQYNLWRQDKQTAKTTMANLGLKKSKFYSFVRAYEQGNEELKKVS